MSSSANTSPSHQKFNKICQPHSKTPTSSGLRQLKDLKTYTVNYFYDGCEEMNRLNFTIDISTNISVSRAILTFIKHINTKVLMKSQTLLKCDPKKFYLYFPKKNGSPKEDLPGFYSLF